jgi:YfiR/HmsC-like
MKPLRFIVKQDSLIRSYFDKGKVTAGNILIGEIFENITNRKARGGELLTERAIFTRCKRGMILAFLLFISLPFAPGFSGNLPLKVQAKFLLMILSHDRNLKNRAGDEIVIGVLSGRGASEVISALDYFTSKTVAGLPIKIIGLEYSDTDNLLSELTQNSINALFVTGGHLTNIDSILSVTKQVQVLSFTNEEMYILSRISVFLTMVDSRPKAVINLKSAVAEGADFDSELLGLADVIR